MHIGICTSVEHAARLPSDAGVDFIEENLQAYLDPLLDEAAFEERFRSIPQTPVPVRSANRFLPDALKCTGARVEEAALDRYAAAAFVRAARAGVRTVVFGSGGARHLVPGFPKATAFGQFIDLLRRLGPLAGEHGITLVIEPLNSGECNFINTLAEGARVVQAANHPNIRLLADLFHMRRDGQSPEDLVRHAALLAHVHIAEDRERACPGTHGDDFRPYFAALRKTDYRGPIAIECRWTDLPAQAPGAVRALREQLSECGF